MHINNFLQLNLFTNLDCPYKFVSGVRGSSLQICLVRMDSELQKISKIVIAEPALILFCLRCSLSSFVRTLNEIFLLCTVMSLCFSVQYCQTFLTIPQLVFLNGIIVLWPPPEPIEI